MFSRNVRRILDNLRNDERGTALIIFAAAVMTLFATGALAVDMGYLYLMKGKSQTTADAAALAGAPELPADGLVLAAANQFAEVNMPQSQYGDTLADSDIRMGAWDPATRSFDATATGTDINAVSVLNRQDAQQNNSVSLFLARALGIRQAAVRTDAVASWIEGDETFSGCFVATEPTAPRSLEVSSNNASIDNGPNCDVVACSRAYDEPPSGYSEPMADDLSVNETAADIRANGVTVGPSCDPSQNGRIAAGNGEFGFAVNNAGSNYCPDIGRIRCPQDSSGNSTFFQAARAAADQIATDECGLSNDTTLEPDKTKWSSRVEDGANILEVASIYNDMDGAICFDPGDLPKKDGANTKVDKYDFGVGYAYVLDGVGEWDAPSIWSGLSAAAGSLFIFHGNASIKMNSTEQVALRGFHTDATPLRGWCGTLCAAGGFNDVIAIETTSSVAAKTHKINGNTNSQFDGAFLMPNSDIEFSGNALSANLGLDSCNVVMGRTLDISGGGAFEVDTTDCDSGLMDELTLNALVPALVQ